MPFLHSEWPAPPSVHALSTRRYPGASLPPFDGNNLALHVNDNPEHVQTNRQALVESLQLPGEPEWLNQTHTNLCVLVEQDSNRNADAAVTRKADTVLAIMTADCLPIVICNEQGNEVAAIHAGWRGLANGIIENTLAMMESPRDELMAWIGPAICGACYEVGDDVRDAYLNAWEFSDPYFKARDGKWLLDLPGVAKNVLLELGLGAVYPSLECTFEKKSDYYSWRRDVQTGRIATLIWFNPTNQD